jgi:hypothetical protein
MSIATPTYYSLPQILERVLETHLHPLLDKPARYQQKWTYNNVMVISEYFQYQENLLPSHKTPLNPSRYGPNEGWIPLSIEQTNLGKKNNGINFCQMHLFGFTHSRPAKTQQDKWNQKQINKQVPLPMQQQRDHQRSQDYSQLDN